MLICLSQEFAPEKVPILWKTIRLFGRSLHLRRSCWSQLVLRAIIVLSGLEVLVLRRVACIVMALGVRPSRLRVSLRHFLFDILSIGRVAISIGFIYVEVFLVAVVQRPELLLLLRLLSCWRWSRRTLSSWRLLSSWLFLIKIICFFLSFCSLRLFINVLISRPEIKLQSHTVVADGEV